MDKLATVVLTLDHITERTRSQPGWLQTALTRVVTLGRNPSAPLRLRPVSLSSFMLSFRGLPIDTC
jgi:hypothetical protein